ncbi:MAG: GH3 auxin-responsive promoter family protein [Cyclobacteriaceae bacterium]
MGLINSILTWVMKKRIHDIELFMKYPLEVQDELFLKLIARGKDTGVPVQKYEELYPYIKRIMQGEQNVLWPTDITWFAKSSGTTNARSKFIPVSPEALEECHFKGGKDLISIYINNYPDSRMFTGKGLAIGGSHQINEYDPGANSYYGDVSAVIMKNLPLWAQIIRTPSLDVALMDKWEEKIEKMARITMEQNVTSLSGVPTWTILLIQRILELKNTDNLLDVWPNIEVFFHGAVAFTPYRSLFQKLIPSHQMRYVETYNASEGFFGIQDQIGSSELLLMLDYSTNSGLWRYSIGDTVVFTSVKPYRVKISGRTKHFINAFGEELIIENAESAITDACTHTNAIIDNFTAAPIFFSDNKRARHEWIVEFRQTPDDPDNFNKILDARLREINSDYDAKRYKDMALIEPLIHHVPQGTFYNWMKKRNKLGGQNKVPRLSNNREYVESILEMIREKKH